VIVFDREGYSPEFFKEMWQIHHVACITYHKFPKRPVVNFKWRELDRRRRPVKSKLIHQQARFAAVTLHPESDESALAKWENRKAEVVEAIEQFKKELTDINDRGKTTPSHLKWDELPETKKFERLAPSRKQLVVTVKWEIQAAPPGYAAPCRRRFLPITSTADARFALFGR
jgi:hypothetical protein